MNCLRLAALALVSLSASLHAQNLDLLTGGGKKESVTAAIVSEVKAAAPGKAFRAAVKIVHEPHFHTYGKVVAAGATGLPTKLAWTLPEGWKVEELPWPATTPFESFGAKAEGYEGTVHLPVRITPAPGAAAGSTAELQVAVSGLVCDDKTCLPFTTKAALPLPLTASAEVDEKSAAVFGAVTVEEDPGVEITLLSEVESAAPGKSFRVAVRLAHEPKHHTYGKVLPPGVVGSPTILEWTLPAGWTVSDLPWPKPTPFLSFGDKAEGYEGTVHLPARINVPAGAVIGSTADLKLKVDYQVCDDETCLRESKELSLALPVAAGEKLDAGHASVFGALPVDAPAGGKADAAEDAPLGLGSLLLYALLGGLILNVMPCVFPVLGIKVTSVVQQAGEDRRKVVLHGLIYTLGILICFWIMGGLAIALNQGWGSQLQSSAFNFGLAAFFLVFAMNMAGVFEIGASAVGVGSNLQQKSGLAGSFFSGLLAVIVATPCSAPFLGTALGATLALPPAQSMLIFTCIGLGLASPFLLLSIAPGLVSALPRPGAWMESFKQGMSFLLFGTVAFMIFVLSSQIEGLPLLIAMLSLVLIGFGFWIYGRWALPHKPARTIWIARLLTLAAVVVGFWFGLPGADAAKTKSEGKTVSNDPDALTWDTWSAEKVAALRAAKVPVYIDYTASWCWTCQVNKRVYSDAALRELFRKHKVATLKADWSDVNDTIREALAALGKRAVPVNVLYLPGAEDPVILPELLTVENVSEALKRIPSP
ncbi:MAG: thioredoxin family protein [Verrucomicrobiaceae bacterium]|nr:thioredoxin family protein [Verrucomicrobiaceae bacterium]